MASCSCDFVIYLLAQVDAEALPQLPPEKMAKYDTWWKQWGRSASRDSDASFASSATESDGSDVMSTVQQMAPGPLKTALLEVLQKEAVPREPAQAAPSVQPEPVRVQAPPAAMAVQPPPQVANATNVAPPVPVVPESKTAGGWQFNSSTHMAEWTCFSRFCLNNHEQCSSLYKAWKRLICNQFLACMCELMLHLTL